MSSITSKPNSLLPAHPTGLLTVAGLSTRLRSLGAKKTEDDRIDVGIMRLDEVPWQALEASNFLTWLGEQLCFLKLFVSRRLFRLGICREKKGDPRR